jgi:hypothetical protein
MTIFNISQLGINRSDIELLATLIVVIGNYRVQRKFFDFKSKDDLIEDLTQSNRAKDELIEGLKKENEKLTFHRSVCKVKHDKT